MSTVTEILLQNPSQLWLMIDVGSGTSHQQSYMTSYILHTWIVLTEESRRKIIAQIKAHQRWSQVSMHDDYYLMKAMPMITK
jgi:hypothetical protein